MILDFLLGFLAGGIFGAMIVFYYFDDALWLIRHYKRASKWKEEFMFDDEDEKELPTNSTGVAPMVDSEEEIKKISEEMGIPLRDSKDEANGE